MTACLDATNNVGQTQGNPKAVDKEFCMHLARTVIYTAVKNIFELQPKLDALKKVWIF